MSYAVSIHASYDMMSLMYPISHYKNLVGDKLAVGLDDNCVEVLHPLLHVRGHRVARAQGKDVGDQALVEGGF